MIRHEVHTKGQLWCLLGFVSVIKIKSSALDNTGKCAAKDYHRVLTMILPDIAADHPEGECHQTLCLNDNFIDEKVKCPIAVIIGDTKWKIWISIKHYLFMYYLEAKRSTASFYS